MRAILLTLLLVPALALAQGNSDNRPPDNRPPDFGGGDSNVDVDVGGTDIDIGGTTVNTGDVNVPVDVGATTVNSPVSMQNETRTFAFSNSLGDVDIAGCLGSTQWATPIYSRQGLKLNWPCMAEFYLRNGKYELAAMAICNTEIIKEFEGRGISKEQAEASCEAAHSFGPTLAELEAIEPAAAPPSFETFEEHNEDVIEIQIAQQALQMEVQELRAELEAERSRPAAQPRVVERVVQQPEPELTDAEKYAILGLLMGEDEDE